MEYEIDTELEPIAEQRLASTQRERPRSVARGFGSPEVTSDYRDPQNGLLIPEEEL